MTHPTATVDVNADLGEGFPNDEALLKRVTSTSVSCGAHAGDQDTIRRTLELARRYRVAVGAHPGFADRAHFGRREQAISAAGAEQLVTEQVDALTALAREAGIPLNFVKPHGALYNQAQRDEAVAEGIVKALVRLRFPVLGQPGSALERRAIAASLPFIGEGFPERRYGPDGRLVARGEPNAVLREPREIAEQALRLVQQGARTLCVHGDDPDAVSKADSILAALKNAAIAIRSFVAAPSE